MCRLLPFYEVQNEKGNDEKKIVDVMYVRARMTMRMSVRTYVHVQLNEKASSERSTSISPSLSLFKSLSRASPLNASPSRESAKEIRRKLQKGWPRMQVTICVDRSIVCFSRPIGVWSIRPPWASFSYPI